MSAFKNIHLFRALLAQSVLSLYCQVCVLNPLVCEDTLQKGHNSAAISRGR